jgi:deoxyribodipyrimidine photo-lyase
MSAALVWFRQDLRLSDNDALNRALATAAVVVPVFIWSPDEEAPWCPGAASQWWLHQSLTALHASLTARGSRLVIRRGPAEKALRGVASECGAAAIFWNRSYEPAGVARDTEVKQRLRGAGLAAETCPGNLLFEPGTIRNKSGKPFQVFSAFWRACMAMPSPSVPKAAPQRLRAPERWPSSLTISDLRLEPTANWAGGLRETWRPGEPGAAGELAAFVGRAIESYDAERNRPDHRGTSRLAPHVHFGEISPRQIWHALRDVPAAEAYRRQIVWREFAYHLLFHYPHTPYEPLRPEFRDFPWQMDAQRLRAWTLGKTGYPLVDAGMRELWHTGWMHNRVRMVAASFLVKHLLIPWQEGAAWFWDTLVDADLANNSLGWQWVAGCGADAAPYFRIFNPVLQGERFDPNGDYVRRWVPELIGVPNRWIHKPWQAPPGLLADAGVRLGKNYPAPIVDHGEARRLALAALAKMRTRYGGHR